MKNHYKEAYEELFSTIISWNEEYQKGTFDDPQEALSAIKTLVIDNAQKFALGTANLFVQSREQTWTEEEVQQEYERLTTFV
jgi:hypothetical protein